MTEINTILTQLEAASHAGTLKRYEKIGETKPYYGVPMGAISGIAKAYKNRLDLFAPLWQTGVLEAQYLAIQIAKTKPDQLTSAALEACLNEQVSVNVLDKLASIILSKRKDSKDWEAYLLDKNSAIFQRLGWFLRAKYFAGKTATNQEIEETLDHIRQHLQNAEPVLGGDCCCLPRLSRTRPCNRSGVSCLCGHESSKRLYFCLRTRLD
ncbi:TPA: DNA alkylation repair protein [Streptococcus suis]